MVPSVSAMRIATVRISHPPTLPPGYARVVRSTVAPVVFLLGCGSAHLGAPCSQTHPCGDDEVCDLTDPNGPICIDANGDLDGDGIPNRLDHCNHMPGGEFDEDQDGLGDECDPCPIAK